MKSIMKNIFLSTTLSVFSILASAAELLGEKAWLFNSVYGEKFQISYEKSSLLYAVTLGDVTEKVQPCNNTSLKLCIQTNTFDLAIPKEKPTLGSSWSINNTVYKLEGRLEGLKLFNRTFNDIFVIYAERDVIDFGKKAGVKRFKFFYSYTDGLIFFIQVFGKVDSPIFISSQIPSIGSVEAETAETAETGS